MLPNTLAPRTLAAYALCLAACSSDVIVLGQREPPRYRFAPPTRIAELASAAKTDNPSLTADLLEIVFTSERSGVPADVWFATRTARDAAFGTPQLATGLNSPGLETSPVISADGLEFWVASDREGGLGDLDIWHASRPSRSAAWSALTNLTSLNSPAKDLPRPLGEHGRVMPVGSDRDERGYYHIYFAARSEASAGFETPVLVSELSQARESTVDGFLSDDGLTLFFSSGPAVGPADLYVSARKTLDEPFGARVPLDDLNTSSDERDPWLSADGTQFYFSSDRSGHYAIYVAEVRPSAPGF